MDDFLFPDLKHDLLKALQLLDGQLIDLDALVAGLELGSCRDKGKSEHSLRNITR